MDHPLLRRVWRVSSTSVDMLLVAEASNGRDAIQRFRKHTPDVTLMDLRLPDMSGIDAMIAIRQNFLTPASSFDDFCGRRRDSTSSRDRSSCRMY